MACENRFGWLCGSLALNANIAIPPLTGDRHVGKYDAERRYSVRLRKNTKGYDTAYPGVEVLPGDTFVLTTYGHWDEGLDPFILSVQLKLSELDAVETSSKSSRGGRCVPTSG